MQQGGFWVLRAISCHLAIFVSLMSTLDTGQSYTNAPTHGQQVSEEHVWSWPGVLEVCLLKAMCYPYPYLPFSCERKADSGFSRGCPAGLHSSLTHDNPKFDFALNAGVLLALLIFLSSHVD